MSAMAETIKSLNEPPRGGALSGLGVHRAIVASGGVLLLFVVAAAIAPYFLVDPARIDPLIRLRPPGAEALFGTDQLGRSILSRTISGARVSLAVGAGVMIATIVIGIAVGIICGYIRRIDAVMMRVMDAVMAVPAILLAIALMALSGPSISNLIIAITLPEIPRMARVVRASVLSLRERPFVEAAITAGCGLPTILVRHILPGTLGPVMVQATYVFASAMIIEAVLSFLGAGTPPATPSWGNMMAEGRQYLQRAPWILAFPGAALTIIVLSVNLLGDAMRDRIDPRLAKTAMPGGKTNVR